MLLELEKAKPEVIEVEKMIHIPRSEFQNLKNELNSIKISQSKTRKWITEANLAILETMMKIKSDATENSARIALDSIDVEIKRGQLVSSEDMRDLRAMRSVRKQKEVVTTTSETPP